MGKHTEKDYKPKMFRYLYNRAVENHGMREVFLRKYRYTRFGIANTMERLQDSNIKPVFQTDNSGGDYFAVAIEIGGNVHYAVVPRFDLTLQASIYRNSAIGWVFDCPNYNQKLRYRRLKVVKPAFFEPDPAKRCWILREKGKLELGQGQEE